MNFPMYTRFECLNFKIKVKDVDDLDEKIQANLLCEQAYVCRNWRFWIRPFPVTFRGERTDERTDVHNLYDIA